METFHYGIDRLSAGIALDICHGRIKGEITPKAAEQINNNRKIVENLVRQKKIVYGINTSYLKITPGNYNTICLQVIVSEWENIFLLKFPN